MLARCAPFVGQCLDTRGKVSGDVLSDILYLGNFFPSHNIVAVFQQRNWNLNSLNNASSKKRRGKQYKAAVTDLNRRAATLSEYEVVSPTRTSRIIQDTTSDDGYAADTPRWHSCCVNPLYAHV